MRFKYENGTAIKTAHSYTNMTKKEVYNFLIHCLSALQRSKKGERDFIEEYHSEGFIFGIGKDNRKGIYTFRFSIATEERKIYARKVCLHETVLITFIESMLRSKLYEKQRSILEKTILSLRNYNGKHLTSKVA